MISIAGLVRQGYPDITANRMSMRHGSDMLLAAIRPDLAVPEPPQAPLPVFRRRGPRQPYVAPVKAHQQHKVPLIARNLIKAVAADLLLEPEDITGPARFNEIVAARAVVTRILRDRGWSYPRIGAALGGRDHSTIINLSEKWDIYAARDPMALAAYERHRAMDGLV